MRPTIRQLEYLVALAETLHFGRAAARAHVSQPGLSAQIKQLEQMLGVTLFERTRRSVLLTPAGEAAVESARRVLSETDGFVDVAQRFANPLEGQLAMGVIPTVGPYVLPRLLPEIRRRYPGLQLSLTEDETRRLVAGVRKGTQDLLLLALEANLGALETFPLFEDPFLLVVATTHPLASRKRVTEDDLHGERVLLLEDGHWLRTQALAICRSAHAKENTDLRATSLSTLVHMVAGGMGVTLLPSLAVPYEADPNDALVAIPFRGAAPIRTIGLAWRKRAPRHRAYEALAEALAAVR